MMVGYAYTSTLLLPEREAGAPPWGIPLDVRRVPSDGDAELMGAQALQTLLEKAMDRHPFTLMRVVMRDGAGRPLHKRSLWLILFGAC